MGLRTLLSPLRAALVRVVWVMFLVVLYCVVTAGINAGIHALRSG